VREQLALKKNSVQSTTKSMIEEHRQWFSQLKTEHQAVLDQWRELNRQFVKRIPQIKKNLEDSSVFKNVKKISKQDLAKNNVSAPVIDVLIDDANLKVQVKDQGDRPTCSAFAGSILIEALLQKNNINLNVSPEYLYYASKPDCQKNPCATVGSWIGYGFEYSQKKSSPDIPAINDCLYVNTVPSNNQTNLPLADGCTNGQVQIKAFRYITTMQQAYQEIQKGKSIFLSLKLSENFYDNKGIIYSSEAKKGNTKLDDHSKGHAVVLVGVMPLPSKVQAVEGKYCWIVKNSWGLGWGKGGYACLSDQWLANHRSTNPMVVLEQIYHNTYGILQ
jgi:C1A family cysteine protease